MLREADGLKNTLGARRGCSILEQCVKACCVPAVCKFFKESTDRTNMLDDWTRRNPERSIACVHLLHMFILVRCLMHMFLFMS